MKPENCKIGMKIERFFDSHNNVKKGSVYTVVGVNIEGESARLKEPNDNYWYDLNMFRLAEPVNQFEVGDEAVWNNKVEIWGKRYDKELEEYEYAVTDKNNGRTLLFESELSPLKKKDELEIGDKFKVETSTGTTDRINKVLGVFKDNKYNQIKYVARRVQGDWKGFVDIYNSESIAEIIYE